MLPAVVGHVLAVVSVHDSRMKATCSLLVAAEGQDSDSNLSNVGKIIPPHSSSLHGPVRP